ncbi:hypothetical protein AGMMS50267_01330 [Spirochaetia bacterium]|nr:hypothetical protein AGMMS50267_01330 [Spirochaetia bacterium]
MKHNERVKALADLKEKAAESGLQISEETALEFLNDPENVKVFNTNPNDPYTKTTIRSPIKEAEKLIAEREEVRKELY